MDDATRHALVQLLGNAMSDVSEECWCAGWLGGTEHIVPELCRRALASRQTSCWGRWEVTLERARGLQALADHIGSWANLDNDATGYIAFQPFPIPSEYLESIEREQSVRT